MFSGKGTRRISVLTVIGTTLVGLLALLGLSAADAAPPYTTGFISLINGESPPENCFGCQPVADETWLIWLRARRDQLDPPTVSRLAQWGSYALMQVSSPSGSFAVQCWLSGLSTPRLERCQEIESQPPP